MKNSILTVFLLLTFGSGEVVFGQWTSLNTGTIEYLNNVNFPAVDTGYVIQSSGVMRKSVDAGQSWTFVNSNAFVWDIAFTTADEGFGIGASTIYHTINSGISWDTVYNDQGIFLYKIYQKGPDFIYAIGDNGLDSALVITSYDNGLNWTRRAFSDGALWSLVGSYFLNPSLGYANDFSAVYKTLDSGQTWVNLNLNPNNAYNSVYFLSPDTGFALATILLNTTDGGITWNQVNTNGNNTAFYDMKFINDTLGYVVGGDGLTAGPILKTTNGGVTWNLDTSSVQTFMSIYYTSDNIIYASGTGGALWKLDLFTGLTETASNSEVVKLIHDFSGQQFILEGTHSLGEIIIFDNVGKILGRQASENNASVIDVKNFSTGIYIIKYRNKDTSCAFKGIKK